MRAALTQFADAAQRSHEQHQYHGAVRNDQRFALQVLGLAVVEERGGHVGDLELHERGELDATWRLVAVRREAQVQHEEAQARAAREPELQ